MKLACAGYLRGWRVAWWHWQYSNGDISSIDIEDGRDAIVLKYRTRSYGQEWQSVEQRVPIRWTPCRFGGERPWFLCAVHCNGVYCGRRVAKLYGAGQLFACRHCYRLGYAVQRGGPMDKVHQNLARLHRKLGADYDGPDMPAPPKPKWMRWRTYSGIVHQIQVGQARLDAVFIVGAQRLIRLSFRRESG